MENTVEPIGSRSNSINNLKTRLQFVVILVLFFPTLIDSLFKLAGNPTGSSKLIIQWNIIVFVFVVIYLLVETLEKCIYDNFLKWINASILLEIAMFAPILYYLAKYQNGIIAGIPKAIFVASSFGLLIFPLVIFILLVVSITIYAFKNGV